MKTIDRYIALTFLQNFIVAALGLTALYLFQALMGDVLNGDYPIRQILVFNGLQAPEVFTLMAPPAVLLGTVFTLSGLNRTNELTACFSIGMGLKRIMALLLVLVTLISGVLLFFQDSVLPPVYRNRTVYYWREMKKRSDFHLDIKQNKIWYRSKELIYNLKTFDTKTQTIKGMTVYAFDDSFQLQKLVEAEGAEYTPEGWKLMNGTITQFFPDSPFPESERFRELKLQIAETPKDFMEIEKEVRALRLKELYRYIIENQGAGLDMKAYLVQFHSRFSLSFIPIVMCILAVPFSTRGRREGGMAKDLGICLGVTFFYWLFYSIGLSLGTNGALPPVVAAWAPTIIFGFLALALVSQSQK